MQPMWKKRCSFWPLRQNQVWNAETWMKQKFMCQCPGEVDMDHSLVTLDFWHKVLFGTTASPTTTLGQLATFGQWSLEGTLPGWQCFFLRMISDDMTRLMQPMWKKRCSFWPLRQNQVWNAETWIICCLGVFDAESFCWLCCSPGAGAEFLPSPDDLSPALLAEILSRRLGDFRMGRCGSYCRLMM